MQELNEKEAAVLDDIRRSISQGVIPSVREICSRLRIKSTSTVHRCLRSLEEKGYIERESNCNRCIRLADQAYAAQVPVVGQVAAGMPILANQQVERYIPVDLPFDQDELFALYVHGESMVNIGMLDGDIIVARRTSCARNGDLVVALIDDEATVKRFYKEGKHFRLQPENDEMEPIYTDRLEILGLVVGLQRSYL